MSVSLGRPLHAAGPRGGGASDAQRAPGGAVGMKRLLGLSCFYHDAAAALVVDGSVVAAAQEERFTRRKHDPSFPASAILYCLEEGGLDPGDLDAVVFYDKPLLTFDRLLSSYLAVAPRGLHS